MKSNFTVLRPHVGDKEYSVGDVRTVNASDVAHLVKAGVLEPKEAEDLADENTSPDPQASPSGDGLKDSNTAAQQGGSSSSEPKPKEPAKQKQKSDGKE